MLDYDSSELHNYNQLIHVMNDVKEEAYSKLEIFRKTRKIKTGRLFRLKEIFMNQSEQINELATALAKCQGEMEPAIKDSINPHFKSKFATLFSIWESCRKPLSRNGLSVVQTMDYINDRFCLTTILMHTSGQWLKSITPIISARNDAQGIGSALSYFKRYSLSAMLGICTADEDDDAEGAMPKEKSDKPMKKEVKQKEVIVVDEEQANELITLSDQCDPEYMKKLNSYLKEQGISSLSKLPADMFNKILKGLKTNAEAVRDSGE